MDILEHIKQLSKERGWSNYRLAKESGLSDGVLNNLFRLGNQPTIPTLAALCSGLGITLSQFFAGNGEAVVLDDEQRRLLDVWSRLTEKQKCAVFLLLSVL